MSGYETLLPSSIDHRLASGGAMWVSVLAPVWAGLIWKVTAAPAPPPPPPAVPAEASPPPAPEPRSCAEHPARKNRPRDTKFEYAAIRFMMNETSLAGEGSCRRGRLMKDHGQADERHEESIRLARRRARRTAARAARSPSPIQVGARPSADESAQPPSSRYTCVGPGRTHSLDTGSHVYPPAQSATVWQDVSHAPVSGLHAKGEHSGWSGVQVPSATAPRASEQASQAASSHA